MEQLKRVFVFALAPDDVPGLVVVVVVVFDLSAFSCVCCVVTGWLVSGLTI